MKFLLTAAAALGLMAGAASAQSRLETVQERGKLLCSGHNGSYLGFAEVDDQGNWEGLDIDLCRGLAASLFGKAEGHLDIVPISWAQRWPALQSGDIDVIIKLSGWSQSRDTELNLAFSNPYFVAGFHVMTNADLGVESVAGLDGGSICVSAGTTTERFLAAYVEKLGIDVEIIVFESGDEVRTAYFNGRCDGLTLLAPPLAAARATSENPEAHVILPDVIALEPEGIIVPEGDPKWLDVMNWMLSSLWFAELNGITSENVDEIKANPPSAQIGKFLGVTPGYGSRLGLSDDWAYNLITEVGNYAEIYDRNIGVPYALPRAKNNLYINGGLFYPLMVD
ncbi:transporter substrate-binding domain-containing protein [Marinovum sp. SP66]|uniref:transporter substrate-binding domain-containing protein n=1 Tax=Marinovum TaxID=367771 RepID=UPI00237A85C8|nr:transporter substrate-binding domain-containing protein [Marinovum sp. SP66]MDD9739369.1 transporter substrate-binding domain-containing protein [Marinovum sp. SP66]